MEAFCAIRSLNNAESQRNNGSKTPLNPFRYASRTMDGVIVSRIGRDSSVSRALARSSRHEEDSTKFCAVSLREHGLFERPIGILRSRHDKLV